MAYNSRRRKYEIKSSNDKGNCSQKMLIEKQKKACKKAWNKNQNQSISMRKLLCNDSRAAELDTFKNILFDLATIVFELDETLIFFFN